MVRYNNSKSKSSLNKRKKIKNVNRRKSGGTFTNFVSSAANKTGQGLKYIGKKGIDGGKYIGERGIEGGKATANYIKKERKRNQSNECMDTPDCSEAIEKCKKRKSEAIKNITEMNIKKSNGFMLVGKNCGDDWVNDCSTSLESCNKRISELRELDNKSIKAGSRKKRKNKTKKAKTKKAKTKKAKTKKAKTKKAKTKKKRSSKKRTNRRRRSTKE